MKRGKYAIVFCVIGIICLGFLGCGTVDLIKVEVKMQSGDYQEAITILKEYLTKEPDSVWARTQLGKAYLNLEDLDSAIDSLLKVQQIKPKEPRSTLFLGLAYIGKEQYEKAIATWEGYKSKNSIIAAEIKKQLTLLKITYSRKMAQSWPSDRCRESRSRYLVFRKYSDRYVIGINLQRRSHWEYNNYSQRG